LAFTSAFLTIASNASIADKELEAALTPHEKASLKDFLLSISDEKVSQPAMAFRDLNRDGREEVLVYMRGRQWCGSGGCTTLILSRGMDSWKVVSKIPVTRPPIKVLSSTSNGWHDVGVTVGGGGIQTSYEVRLRFDGHTYPQNPTASPAGRSAGTLKGDAVIE